jgi:hypothetical protein
MTRQSSDWKFRLVEVDWTAVTKIKFHHASRLAACRSHAVLAASNFGVLPMFSPRFCGRRLRCQRATYPTPARGLLFTV